MQRPHWHTGVQGGLWPRPCMSGLAGPAESREPRRRGHWQGRRGWPASPSSVRKVRGPVPMGCVLRDHILVSSWNTSSSQGGESLTGARSWAPHPPRDPAGTQLCPPWAWGSTVSDPVLSHPHPGSSPRRSVLLSLALLSSRRLTAGLLCTPPCPPCVSRAQGPHAWASAEVPRSPGPDLGMVP